MWLIDRDFFGVAVLGLVASVTVALACIVHAPPPDSRAAGSDSPGSDGWHVRSAVQPTGLVSAGSILPTAPPADGASAAMALTPTAHEARGLAAAAPAWHPDDRQDVLGVLGVSDARRDRVAGHREADALRARPMIAGRFRMRRSERAQTLQWPVRFSRISAHFGHRLHPISGAPDHHTGIDMAAPSGSRVTAAADGVVEFAGWRGGYGKTVVLRHALNRRTLYAHLASWAPGLHAGRPLRQGDPIGAVGRTGRATGPHLHFELQLGHRAIDPLLADGLAPMQVAGAQ